MRNFAAVAILSFLISVVRCDREPAPPLLDVRTRPPSLIVLPGAQKVAYTVHSGSDTIQYTVAIPYPAEAAIHQIAQNLAKLGRKPLREHPTNPGLESSYVLGWNADRTRMPEMHVYQWMSHWSGPSGALLEYVLRYEFPERSDPEVSTLWVTATQFPPEIAEQTIAAEAGEQRIRRLKALESPPDVPPVVLGLHSSGAKARRLG